MFYSFEIVSILIPIVEWSLSNDNFRRERRRDLTQSCDKAPSTRKWKKVRRQHKDATKKFHYTCTTTVDRLRTVSWSNYCHLTGVVKLSGILTFPLIAKALLLKGHTLQKKKPNHPYKDKVPTANRSLVIIKIQHTIIFGYKTLIYYIKIYIDFR